VRPVEKNPPFATGTKFREYAVLDGDLNVKTIRVLEVCRNSHNGSAKAAREG
jgi:hypothetical protein